MVENLELFNEDFIKIPPGKMNEKNASATKTTEKVGGHGYALLEGGVRALSCQSSDK